MKKICLLLLGLVAFSITKAQFPVTDFGNISMKILDYVEFTSTASDVAKNYTEAKKIFEQGEKYYESLKDVHEIVKKSRNVKGCITLSSETLVNYQDTYRKILNDRNFSSNQINVYKKQQENILSAIQKNIEGLNNIIINTGMSISDKERLDAIDSYHSRIMALHNESRGLNYQMLGESESIEKRKAQKRLERELLR